jgi:predicted O-methyltransferase YrrM
LQFEWGAAQVDEYIRSIYLAGSVTGRSGKTHTLHSAIDPEESEFLSKLIKNDPEVKKTLEVGCAYGLSSLSICQATKGRSGASHTIVDPFQSTQWDGVATKYLEEAGIDFFNLIEVKSEFALPQILQTNEGQFDFVFVDGWHTFDHTLLDCFYATRLLRIGGYLAVDDASWQSVGRAVSFVSNYPCYEEYDAIVDGRSKTWKQRLARILIRPVPRKIWEKILNQGLYGKLFDDRAARIVVFKKVTEDTRNWDWHDDRF